LFIKLVQMSGSDVCLDGQLDSSLVDYLHKRKFPILGPIATWTLRTATVGVLVGVYQFNTNDIGA
jgi:hypothetical protein